MYAKSKKNKNLALFDFDGTLCKKDSFTGFIFYALSKRHIVKQGIKLLPWIQAYYLKVYPAQSMRPKLFNAMLKGSCASEMASLASEYATTLVNSFDPLIYRRLLDHQRLGDEVIIVSASIDIYLKEIASLLGVGLICSETEINDGYYTGQYITPDCSNEQKSLRILEQIDLAQFIHVYAYGNSVEDEAMLGLADFSFMVGKDQYLPMIRSEKKLA